MITSPSNSRIKQLIQLKNRAKARREADAYLIEGIRMFCEAPREQMLEVYVTQEFLERLSGEDGDGHQRRETSQELEETARKRLQEIRYETVSEEVFAKVTDTVTPQGILCVMRCVHYELQNLLEQENPFLLMLEDIQDPGNLGTMIRTAEGAGITGLLMSRGCADIYNPKVVRATMGSLFRMPFVTLEHLPEAESVLTGKGFRIYAAALGGAVSYTEADYHGRTAILIGNEGNGLTAEAVAAATKPIFIPMEGKVESLNAAISAAVLMYHAKEQRSF